MELQTGYAKIQELGAEVIAVVYQSTGGAVKACQTAGAEYHVLADPDHSVADAYGVFDLLGDGVNTPSTFVIDKEGKIVWYYVGKSAGDYPSIPAVIEQLSLIR